MTAIDTRNAIMALADELNRHRQSLLDTIKEINQGIGVLVGEADKLMLKVADERSAGVKATVTKGYETIHPSPEDIADFVAPGRKCGLCGERGHNARTCPNAHKVKAEKEQSGGPPPREGQRKCGKCGEYGHNARTCSKG